MAASGEPRALVLFVQSQKVIDQVYHGLDPRLSNDEDQMAYLPTYAVSPLGSRVMGAEVTEYQEHEELAQPEYDCILRTWRVSHEFGYRLRLVDISKESEFRSWIDRHKHHLSVFPVLLLPDGRHLSGPDELTEPRLREALQPRP